MIPGIYVRLKVQPAKGYRTKHAFTLIELSIVLVIIGFIVGGILVGQELISAAAVRAQISQIEKFNTAVRTFQLKYGYLPGDMPDPYASQFGFAARGTAPGQGDGDGMIAGFEPGLNYVGIGWQPCGEPQVFWVDLSAAGLIEGGFHTATPTACPNVQVPASGLPDYYPRANLGNGLYVYTASAYMSPVCTCTSGIIKRVLTK